MGLPRIISRVGLLSAVFVVGLTAFGPRLLASPLPAVPELRIRELNVSSDNFVVLQNIGANISDLGAYWLGYASSSSEAPLVPTQQLPAVPLANGESIIVLYDGSTDTCDASYVAKLSFDFAASGGTFAVWQLASGSAGSLTFTQADAVSWSKPQSKSAVVPPGTIDVRQETLPAPAVFANPVWYRDLSGAAADWTVGDLQACTLSTYDATSTTWQQTVTWPQAGGSPPSIREASVIIGGSGQSAGIPAVDKGLLAMQLSELLPNTAKPQTDADNEFIELYNPNSKPFDLSNFTLQTASSTSSTVHSWHIPAGTKVGPGAFKAFYSSQTHLSLSNSGGEVWLVDPLGTTVTHSAAYGKAGDGMAWVNAGGKWQWTALPTPNATDKVATPVQAGVVKTATVGNKKVANVASSGGVVAGASTTAAAGQTAQGAPIHLWILAAVALAALLYGAYEYRHDLAYRINKYRANRAARR